MSNQAIPFIAAQTAAVAASGATKFHVKSGELARISVDAGIGPGEEVEILEDIAGTYVSITDASDPVDTTKKLLTSAMNNRTVTGPFFGAISKGVTVSNTAVYIHK